MKRLLKSICFVSATLLLILVSQSTLLAESNDGQTASAGLSAGQAAGGFVLLMLVLLLPLVKSRNKPVAVK
jgi:hypothetical protein